MKYLLFLLWTIPIVSISSAQVTAEQKQQAKLLQAAYAEGSKEKLEKFFENWAQQTPALTDSAIEKLNDTTRNAYLVFQTFYNPLDIQRTGGSEFGNDIYKKVKYLLIQSEIKIGFADSLDEDALLQHAAENYSNRPSQRDSLIKQYKTGTDGFKALYIEFPKPKDFGRVPYFRPKLAFSSPKALVLTGFYDNLLNSFLGNTHTPLGAGSIMSPARSKGESQRRQQFLENYIRIFYGHWGGYWQLYSYPTVGYITFDKAFNNAVVDYRMVYEGGFAYFKKVNGTWKLMDGQRTWIE